jgi:hypothetical protein
VAYGLLSIREALCIERALDDAGVPGHEAESREEVPEGGALRVRPERFGSDDNERRHAGGASGPPEGLAIAELTERRGRLDAGPSGEQQSERVVGGPGDLHR